MTSTLDKVTAFVTRETGTERELLVFQHPTAGIQLPAGTAEAGESVEQAVLREVAEETGLTDVEIVDHFSTIDPALAEDERVLLQEAVLQTSPGDEATLVKAVMLRRGMVVRVLASEGKYVRVTYPEYAQRGDELITVSARTGWLPVKVLTGEVQRHLFHLTTTAPTEHHWTKDADGHQFSLFWVPLSQDPGLTPACDRWYREVRDQLRAS